MSVDTRSIMTCSYGSANFCIETYTLSSKPKYKDGVGMIGLDQQIQCEGFVDADNLTDFNTRLNAVRLAMLTPGRDFIVTGLGGNTAVAMLAAACQYGGPFCEVTSDSPGSSPLMQNFKFTISSPVNAATGGNSNNTNPPPTDTYKAKVSKTPDGLQMITWTGTLNGAGAQTTFNSTKLPNFQSQYALPNWVVKSEVENSIDSAGTQCNYTLTAQQTAGAGVPSGAVDGEATYDFDIDENGRKTENWNYNCLITGDPVAFHQQMRTTALQAGGTMFKETYSATSVKGINVQGSFTVLSSAEGDSLLSWNQTLKAETPETFYKEMMFPGADALAAQEPNTLGHITQSGSAIGLATFPYPPDPIGDMLTKVRDIEYEDMDAVQKKTSWSYEMLAVNSDGSSVTVDPTTLGRPT